MNEANNFQIAEKTLCFIPCVMVSCFVNQIVKLNIILKWNKKRKLS